MRSRPFVLFAALLLVGSLAACGSDDGGDEAATTTTAAKTTTTAERDTTTTGGDDDGTTTTTQVSSPTDTSSDDSTTTTADVSIPSEEPSEEFCEAWRSADEAEFPDGEDLDELKAYFADVQTAVEQMRDNAPDDFRDRLDTAVDLYEEANGIIESASSIEDIENSQELEQIFSDENDPGLDAVDAYGEQKC